MRRAEPARRALQEHLEARSDRDRAAAASDDTEGRRGLRFVTQRLVRWLRKGDVVLMDNLRAHKRPEIVQAILAAGAVPIYLPPYSPDMNPIEFWWADIKRQLRQFAIDTEPELIEAIRRLRAKLTDAKVAGWYRHVQAQLN